MLGKQCDAGTPWRARDALEVLAMLDMPVWVSLLGLMDECPVIPAALVATLEGRTRPVSATAFEFISTITQIQTISDSWRGFLRRCAAELGMTPIPAGVDGQGRWGQQCACRLSPADG
jgi:hypothetical protein